MFAFVKDIIYNGRISFSQISLFLLYTYALQLFWETDRYLEQKKDE